MSATIPASISKRAITTRQSGKVFLVGAGPGDPDLLTVKALRTIQSADLILFDNLVSEEIRQLFPEATPCRYVGKAKEKHSIPQKHLNQLLIDEAQQGKIICRLKGGDPFVFGRGSEEMLSLHKAGIAAEVIPGITAASGCTSYAGIPLTHRGISQSCTFVTAHGETALNINWQALAQQQNTLVFYMGLGHCEEIREQLTLAGMSIDTPAALIERGTQMQQRVITGSLKQLPALARQHQLQSPTLIVVGEVVSLAKELQWFSQLPQQISA